MADSMQVTGIAELDDARDALRRVEPAEGAPPTDVAVRRAVDDVTRGCREVQATLDSVAGALQVFAAPESGWGSYGLAGLPAAAAMRVVSSMASQYLEQQTDMGLASWIDVVSECSRTFDAYVAQLGAAMAGSESMAGVRDGSSRVASRAQVDALGELRRETAAWKTVLTPVSQLGTVVDAVKVAVRSAPAADGEAGDEEVALEASAEVVASPLDPGVSDLPAEPVTADDAGAEAQSQGRARWRSPQRLRSEAAHWMSQGRDVAKSAAQKGGEIGKGAIEGVSGIAQPLRSPASGIVEWTARPLLDLKGRVERLPSQLEMLTGDVTLLEVLLDLQMAGLLVDLGEMSDAEASLVEMRLAASVWLPELATTLEEAHRQASAYQVRIERLERAHSEGQVGDRAMVILREEYGAELAEVDATIRRLTANADLWREHGPTVLDGCERWVTGEIDLIRAREYAEYEERQTVSEEAAARDRDRLALLERERDRLRGAAEVLAAW
jgi:hypothetical protein